MAVGHWLSSNMNFNFDLGAVNAGLEAMYSPVKPVAGARPAPLGTPEIFFTKNIDNSRVVKADDPQRAREMAGFFVAVAFLSILLMVYALQHFSSIEYGYKIEAQKKQREELIEANRALKLEEASLRDPERIDILARRMGLTSPQAGQVQRLESEGDASGPVMARATSVAVVVAQ